MVIFNNSNRGCFGIQPWAKTNVVELYIGGASSSKILVYIYIYISTL